MKAKRTGNTVIVSVERGEEVLAALKAICNEQGIRCATVTGIGAANLIEIGLYDTVKHEYRSKRLTGDHELTSITGNISTKDGEIYLHLHATASDASYQTFGGHLSAAVISGACEIFLTIVDAELNRVFDPEIGLNVFALQGVSTD